MFRLILHIQLHWFRISLDINCLFIIIRCYRHGLLRNNGDVISLAYRAINCHSDEVDPGAEVLSNECSVHEATSSSGNGPQKKSVNWSIRTVVSWLFNPENRLRNSLLIKTTSARIKEFIALEVRQCLSLFDPLC